MHKAVRHWLTAVKQARPALFEGRRVLECGALNINGSPREAFERCDYTGLDCRPGPGVDVVCLAHQYEPAAGPFDVVISTEMLEHDPHWRASVRRMVELVATGGALLLSCAGPGRPAHNPEASPEPGYYCNCTEAELRGVITCSGDFEVISIAQKGDDLYVVCVNKAEGGSDE